MAGRPHKQGEFCWINIMTPQQSEARDFFGQLLGWTFDEMPGNMGHTVKVGGQNMGGIFPNVDEKRTTPPGIYVMIKADSADAVAEKVTSLGGKAKPAFDIMQAGRMAICHDPSGAAFDIWQPKQQPDSTVDSKQIGATSWFELLTNDAPGCSKFYSELFGWKTEGRPMPGFEYTLCGLGESDFGGIMPILPFMGECITPGWKVYFTTNDVDATVEKAKQLGGKILMPPMEVPDVGRMSSLESPQGVKFEVIQYAQKATA